MFVFLLGLALAADDIKHFHTGMFERNRDPGLFEVEIGLEDRSMLLSAFGYFNKDK